MARKNPEIGNSLELHVFRNVGTRLDAQSQQPCAALKIYYDGSVVVWANEPRFAMGKTGITLKEDENPWDTIARAIEQARKAW